MQKYQNVAFASKPDFLLKYFENSDFRPCIKCFNTHEEDLKPKETRFWVLFRKIYFYENVFSAFGVELMTVSISKGQEIVWSCLKKVKLNEPSYIKIQALSKSEEFFWEFLF